MALIAVDGKTRPEWISSPAANKLQGEETLQQHEQHEQQQRGGGGGGGDKGDSNGMVSKPRERKSNGLLNKLSRPHLSQPSALPGWYRRGLSGDDCTQIPHTKMVTQVSQSTSSTEGGEDKILPQVTQSTPVTEGGFQSHQHSAASHITSSSGPTEKVTVSTACTTFKRPYPALGGGVILPTGTIRPGTPMPLQVSNIITLSH